MPVDEKKEGSEGMFTRVRRVISENPEKVTAAVGLGLAATAVVARRGRFSRSVPMRFSATMKAQPDTKIALMDALSPKPVLYSDAQWLASNTNGDKLRDVSKLVRKVVEESKLPVDQLDIFFNDRKHHSAAVAAVKSKGGFKVSLSINGAHLNKDNPSAEDMLSHQLKHEFLGHVAARDTEMDVLLNAASLLPMTYGASTLAMHLPSSALFISTAFIARVIALNHWSRRAEIRADERAVAASTDNELAAAQAELSKYVQAEKERQRIDALFQSEAKGLAATKPYQSAKGSVKLMFDRYPSASSRAESIEKERERRKDKETKSLRRQRDFKVFKESRRHGHHHPKVQNYRACPR